MQLVKQLYVSYKHPVKNLSLYFAANVIQVIIGLLMNPVLASNLSPEDFAITGYFDSFSLFILPFVSFSFFAYYSKNYFTWDEAKRKEVLNTLVLFQAFIGLGSMTLLMICLKIYFITQKTSFPFFPYALLSFGKIYVMVFFSFYCLNLRLQKKARSYFSINVVYNLLNVAMALLFVVLLKKGATGRMEGLFLTSFLIGCFVFLRQVKTLRFKPAVAKDAIRFSWPLMFAALLTYFFNGFDKLLLERVKDVHNFGLYNIAGRITSYFVLFSASIDATFEPDFYKAIYKNSRKSLIRVVLTTNFIKVIPVLLFLLSGNVVIALLTNFRYTDATYFARILVCASITQSISFTLSVIIVASGFSKISLLEKLIGSVLVVIMYIIVINRYGFEGAAWGQVCSYLIMSVISCIFIGILYLNKKIFQPVKT